MVHVFRSRLRLLCSAFALLAVLALLAYGLPQGTRVSWSSAVRPTPRWVWDSNQHRFSPPSRPEMSSIAQAEGKIYVSGSMSQLGLPNKVFGTVQPAGGQFSADLPRLDGVVSTIVADGSGGWYVGGRFTAVDRPALQNLIHINANKTLDLSWNPNITDTVDQIVRNGAMLYLKSGFFQNGAPTDRLVAIDIPSAKPTAWERRAGAYEDFSGLSFSMGRVIVVVNNTLTGSDLTALDPANVQHVLWQTHLTPAGYRASVAIDGNTIYSISGSSITKIDITTGKRLPFVNDFGPCYSGGGEGGLGYCPSLHSLAAGNGTLYIQGEFSTFGTQGRPGWAAFNTATGALTPWVPKNPVGKDLLGVSGDTVYIKGSSALQAVDGASGASRGVSDLGAILAVGISPSGLAVKTDLTFQNASSRSNLAAFDAQTGALSPWAPQVDDQVLQIVPHAGRLYAAGNFTKIDQQSRYQLGAFDLASGALLDWNPKPDSAVSMIASSAGRLYVGGRFSQIAGQERPYLAAFDASGALLDWKLQLPNGSIAMPGESVVAVETISNTVYVGTAGRMMGDLFQITAFDRDSGAMTGWTAFEGWPGGALDTLVADGTTLYASGTFADPEAGLMAFDVTKKAAPTLVGPAGRTHGLVRRGRDLFFGTAAGIYRLNLDTKALSGPFGPAYLPDSLADGGDALLGSWCRWIDNDNCRFAVYPQSAPLVTTGAADGLSSSGVTLHGTVDPNETSAAVSFQLTTRRGDCDAIRTLPASTAVLSGTADQPVSLSLADLVPSTTYFYRVVATSRFGANYGAVQQFTTPAGPAAATAPPAAQAASPQADPAPAAHQIFLPVLRRCPAAGEGF